MKKRCKKKNSKWKGNCRATQLMSNRLRMKNGHFCDHTLSGTGTNSSWPFPEANKFYFTQRRKSLNTSWTSRGASFPPSWFPRKRKRPNKCCLWWEFRKLRRVALWTHLHIFKLSPTIYIEWILDWAARLFTQEALPWCETPVPRLSLSSGLRDIILSRLDLILKQSLGSPDPPTLLSDFVPFPQRVTQESLYVFSTRKITEPVASLF